MIIINKDRVLKKNPDFFLIKKLLKQMKIKMMKIIKAKLKMFINNNKMILFKKEMRNKRINNDEYYFKRFFLIYLV